MPRCDQLLSYGHAALASYYGESVSVLNKQRTQVWSGTATVTINKRSDPEDKTGQVATDSGICTISPAPAGLTLKKNETYVKRTDGSTWTVVDFHVAEGNALVIAISCVTTEKIGKI